MLAVSGRLKSAIAVGTRIAPWHPPDHRRRSPAPGSRALAMRHPRSISLSAKPALAELLADAQSLNAAYSQLRIDSAALPHLAG